MATEKFSIRLDKKLAGWVESQTTVDYTSSDVIRDAIMQAMNRKANDITGNDALKKSVDNSVKILKLLEEYITRTCDKQKAADILDHADFEAMVELNSSGEQESSFDSLRSVLGLPAAEVLSF